MKKKNYSKPLVTTIKRRDTNEVKKPKPMYLADGRWCCFMPY